MTAAHFKDAVRAEPRAVDASAASDVLSAVHAPTEVRGLLRGMAGAPFLARTARREAAWLAGLWDMPTEQAFADLIEAVAESAAATHSDVDAGALLRVARRRVALLTALADLGGVWDLEATTAALTRFAEAAVVAATTRLLRAEAATGRLAGLDPEAPGFVILAMGKMGAGELNYSSDIDLIALFDQDRLPPEALGQAKDRFNRLTRGLVKLLSEITTEGYVARVDLRLRPDPGATPACLAMATAESYYEAMGRTWERAAHIKARPVAGDLAAGQAYLKRLRPFVWRRHLDFAAIEDAADMLSRIRAHEGGAEITVVGQDVKLGAGGIREIELLAQTRQLVLGGRDASLRSPRTRDALRALSAAGRLSADEQQALDRAYVHLRTLEHRLQMIEDQQTHRMPTRADALELVAALMGADDWPTLEQETRAHMEAVRRAAGADLDERPSGEDGRTTLAAAAAALPEPERAETIASGWFAGRLRAVRSPRGRAALERLTPSILQRLGEAPDPMHALVRFDQFLNGLPAGVQLLALIESNPRLLDLLIEICAAAPRLADHLARRSAVLDAVLDPGFFAPPPGVETLYEELSTTLAHVDDYERALDAVRRWAGERRFQIGVGLLRGLTTPADAGPAFADVAEACLRALLPHVEAEHARRYGGAPGAGAAVLALGRLGSREMTATSDLDVIIIYDAEPTELSTGPKPIPASQYYARFTQSLTAAVTAPTAEGALYEVDMRLRPSGRSGPLATSLSAFARYQLEDAWVWEHLALTRGRVVAGAPALAERINTAIAAALGRPRSNEEVRQAASEMRAKLNARAEPGRGVWDVKFAPGALFDIEFVVQTELLTAGLAGAGGWGIDDALTLLERDSALASEDIAALRRAYALQVGLLQIERVALADRFNPTEMSEGARAAFLRALGVTDLAALTDRLAQAQSEARAVFAAQIGIADHG